MDNHNKVDKQTAKIKLTNNEKKSCILRVKIRIHVSIIAIVLKRVHVGRRR